MINLSDPKAVKEYAEKEGITVTEVYRRDIVQKTMLIEKDPDNTKLYERRSKDYYAIKNYEAAIEDCFIALTAKPDDASGYNFLGKCYYRLEKYSEAIKYFTKALDYEYYKNNNFSYEYRAKAFYKINNYKDALSDINNAIKYSTSELSDYYMIRSEIYKSLGDLENSKKDYDKWYNLNIEEGIKLVRPYSREERNLFLCHMFDQLSSEEQNLVLAEILLKYTPSIKDKDYFY